MAQSHGAQNAGQIRPYVNQNHTKYTKSQSSAGTGTRLVVFRPLHLNTQTQTGGAPHKAAGNIKNSTYNTDM